jgi:hypothetical protein
LHLLTWRLVTIRIWAIELDVEEVPLDLNEVQIWIIDTASTCAIEVKGAMTYLDGLGWGVVASWSIGLEVADRNGFGQVQEPDIRRRRAGIFGRFG